MTPTLEETLAASIVLAQARKTPAPTAGELILMPKPPAAGSEMPRVLSPSSLNTFLDCSARWYYAKVLRLPETRGSALGLGTAVHTALLENFRQKIETKEDLDYSGTRALFVHALCDELDVMKLQKDESAQDLKDAGETMVRIYMERAAPMVEPAAVEELVEGRIGEVEVHGYIDVRDITGRVIDLKTAKKKPAGITAAHRLQLSTYAMLHPRASGEATITTLTKTNTVALYQDSATIAPEDRKLTTALYSIARDQMAAGVYAPRRSSFLCSRKHCAHWETCEGDFGGKVPGEAGE